MSARSNSSINLRDRDAESCDWNDKLDKGASLMRGTGHHGPSRGGVVDNLSLWEKNPRRLPHINRLVPFMISALALGISSLVE